MARSTYVIAEMRNKCPVLVDQASSPAEAELKIDRLNKKHPKKRYRAARLTVFDKRLPRKLHPETKTFSIGKKRR